MKRNFLNSFLIQKINSTFINVPRVHRQIVYLYFWSYLFLFFILFIYLFIFGKQSGEIRGHLNELIQPKAQNLEKKASHLL